MTQWRPISGFPPYEVSDEGTVRNGDSGHVLGIYDNGGGVKQVVLRRDYKNHARAVHRLVAEAFLDPAPDDCVPMLIDGDHNNMRPDNLVWKPRWYAVKWTRQRRQVEPRDHRPILHVKTGVVYQNALECARSIGGLEDLVILTAQSRWSTTYLGSKFEFYNA